MLFSFRSSGKVCFLIRQYLDRDLKEISQTRELGVGKTFQVEGACAKALRQCVLCKAARVMGVGVAG